MANKTLTATLHISELKYDIMNGTDLVGKSRHTDADGGNDEQVAHLIASEDDWSLNHLLRSIQNASGELRMKLHEFMTSSGTTVDDQLIDEDSDLTFELSLPSNYNYATKESIVNGMHDFIVNSAIGKWFAVTAPNEAETYMNLAGEALSQIMQAIYKRERPTRTAVTNTPTP